ncbi:MAG: ribosomal protein S5 [Parcubacteria bacterium C7867-005]|nr:MAG: ribosomal protein S5 [Parcubacteria bacterium C7867-005]
MDETLNTTEEKVISTDTPVVSDVVPGVVPAAADKPAFNRGDRGGDRGRGKNNNRRSPRRDGQRSKPEFDQKIVSLRRVTRVTSGGRRFAFSACVVAGNKKGMVGVGQGKASDTPLAIEKAFRDARKNMITVNMTKNMSIPHEVDAKYSASVVKIMPAPGKGILAGSSVRTVIELAGLKEISSKLLSRSKNTVNNAYVAIAALKKLDHTKIRHSK